MKKYLYWWMFGLFGLFCVAQKMQAEEKVVQKSGKLFPA